MCCSKLCRELRVQSILLLVCEKYFKIQESSEDDWFYELLVCRSLYSLLFIFYFKELLETSVLHSLCWYLSELHPMDLERGEFGLFKIPFENTLVRITFSFGTWGGHWNAVIELRFFPQVSTHSAKNLRNLLLSFCQYYSGFNLN